MGIVAGARSIHSFSNKRRQSTRAVIWSNYCPRIPVRVVLSSYPVIANMTLIAEIKISLDMYVISQPVKVFTTIYINIDAVRKMQILNILPLKGIVLFTFCL